MISIKPLALCCSLAHTMATFANVIDIEYGKEETLL